MAGPIPSRIGQSDVRRPSKGRPRTRSSARRQRRGSSESASRATKRSQSVPTVCERASRPWDRGRWSNRRSGRHPSDRLGRIPTPSNEGSTGAISRSGHRAFVAQASVEAPFGCMAKKTTSSSAHALGELPGSATDLDRAQHRNFDLDIDAAVAGLPFTKLPARVRVPSGRPAERRVGSAGVGTGASPGSVAAAPVRGGLHTAPPKPEDRLAVGRGIRECDRDLSQVIGIDVLRREHRPERVERGDTVGPGQLQHMG